MIVRRAGRRQRFTILDNDVIEDNELSFRALGLLTYILSKPDDWKTDSVTLARTHAEGRDAVRAALTDLELAGYIVRRKVRQGRAWVTETVVYDRPCDRVIGGISDKDSSGDGFSGVGKSGVGKSGAVPKTVTKDCDQAVPAPSQATSHTDSQPRDAMQPREADETSSTDESPALGVPRRKSNEETKQVASTRGVSGFGLALRLQKGLGNRRDSLAIVDVRALAKRLNEAHRAGQSRELQATMIEMFVASPERYRSGDLKGWTAYLAAVPKLEADAGKVAQVIDPTAKFRSA